MIRRLGPGLQALVAAVFLFSCFAATAHMVMGREGCGAIEPSVRSCGPTTSLETVAALPGLLLAVFVLLVPSAWATTPFSVVGPSQHQIAPFAPRSPPALSA